MDVSFHSITDAEKIQILNDENIEFSQEDLDRLYTLEAYKNADTPPVDIETFLDDRNYLGRYFDGELLSEPGNYWRQVLKEVYPTDNYSPYWLICLKGSIGAGKTTTASAGVLYDLQWLLCNKNPQKFLHIPPTSRIEFAIFNITLTATDVVWDRIASMMADSDFFTHLMGKAKKRFKTDTLFPKRIDFFSGSRIGHSLGRDVYEVIIDEANFEVITGQVRKISIPCSEEWKLLIQTGRVDPLDVEIQNKNHLAEEKFYFI